MLYNRPYRFLCCVYSNLFSMKFFLLPILFFLALRACGQEASEKNVLFISNSLTYYNGMPDYPKAMLSITNQRIAVEVSAYSGMSLEAHLDDIIGSRTPDNINTRKKRSDEQTETEKTILSKKWDIILHEVTIRVLIPEE